MTDEALLERSIARLRTSGAIEYTGEFGAEITTFIPFAHWLKAEGLLEGRRVVTYKGMRPYYYFLDDAEYHEKAAARMWLPVGKRDWPTNSTYTATRQRWHLMPDYRTQYRDRGLTFARPVLFIQNKFAIEWKQGPYNFLPLNTLALLLEKASGQFDIVYSRPRAFTRDVGFSHDDGAYCEYPDLAVVKRFSNVAILEELCDQTGAPYNQTKLEILAKSNFFVAVQGGGTHLLACFGNSLMLLLHTRGDEYPHAYRSGAYKYLSNPPPVILLADGYNKMAAGIDLLCSVQFENGIGRLDANFRPTLEALTI